MATRAVGNDSFLLPEWIDAPIVSGDTASFTAALPAGRIAFGAFVVAAIASVFVIVVDHGLFSSTTLPSG